MKVITILGSPKKKGKTAKALDLFEEKIVSKGGIVERIHVVDYEMNGCQGCYFCQTKEDKPNCVQNDDVLLILKKIVAADAVIYASPIYGFDFTAQIKPLLDRHLCLVTDFATPNMSSVIKGKRTLLLITCADNSDDNADLVQEIFYRNFAGVLKTNIVGKYIIPFSAAPDFEERAQENADKMVKALLHD
ncbi:flavodoxin family protein [Iocasia frigidifontis]|uniref:Flavodoxin family protein n=1 Tax=Iocasia fonsfrigidae TaxID=2682810 RepID=A0A8A7KHJ1_9FIRM|nr:flavodoxin family protein [Iocasia fonsfrigidae]QTL99009.1 flavodoxin family protein [Iocasia fonsfrigidae]